jgi:DNA-binding transcriptional LysR family regulator
MLSISGITLTHVNLNLLLALDALLEEGSVQCAADRLRLSQPAMSRALARLRIATGDDILVRSGRTMVPTPRALELRSQTGDIIARATRILSPPGTLDLAGLDRTFSIRGHDSLLGVMSTGLVEAIAEEAPRVVVRFLSETSSDSSDLQRGRVDLEVGGSAPSNADVVAERVGSDRLVVVMRASSPLAVGDLTVKRFADAVHVTVSRRGRVRGPIDDALELVQLPRQVRVVLPTSAAALELVSRTDVITTVAERSCRSNVDALSLVTRPLPVAVPLVPVVMLWQRRVDRDPAHHWLRTRVGTVLTRALGSS